MESRPQPSTELDAANATIAIFTALTRHADAKVAVLGALYGAVLAIVATRFDIANRIGEGVAAVPTLVCAAGLLVGLLGEGYHLLQAIRPRVSRVTGTNRFSLLATAPALRTGWSDRRAVIEAWRVTEALSDVVVRKLRHVGRAVWWAAAYLSWFLGLLVVRVIQTS